MAAKRTSNPNNASGPATPPPTREQVRKEHNTNAQQGKAFDRQLAQLDEQNQSRMFPKRG